MIEVFNKTWLTNIMPKYYNYNDYKGHSVKVVPVGGLRRIPLLRDWLPYYVGDRVALDVFFKAIPEKQKQYTENPLSDYCIWEIHSNGSRDFVYLVNADNEQYTKRFESQVITQQGDLMIYLGLNHTPDPRAPLLTTEIMHKDRRRYDTLLVLLGIIGGCIATVVSGILMGFIKVEPILRMFITP
jgi:hypothetical protein